MKLPATRSGRFKLGFFMVTGLFVLANLITVAVFEGPRVNGPLWHRMLFNDIGFPFTFRGMDDHSGFAIRSWEVFALDVAICLIMASMVGFALAKFADPDRHNDSICKACGYDLSGIEPGVCPECGEAVAPSSE